MQLPPENSHYDVRVRYGRYVARRLKRAGLTPLAEDVQRSTQALRADGRSLDDADDPIQDALADRDAADDDLDTAAQEYRNALAGQSVDAVNEEPYTLIFDRGIAYYTAASLDQEEVRYTELVQRIEAHVPATDPLRKKTVKAIHTGLADFAAGNKALQAARTAASMQSTKLAHTIDRWERQLEKCYGLLVADRGKAAAERFFPKVRAGRSGASASATDPASTPAAPSGK